jgi:hypothetical protein
MNFNVGKGSIRSIGGWVISLLSILIFLFKRSKSEGMKFDETIFDPDWVM